MFLARLLRAGHSPQSPLPSEKSRTMMRDDSRRSKHPSPINNRWGGCQFKLPSWKAAEEATAGSALKLLKPPAPIAQRSPCVPCHPLDVSLAVQKFQAAAVSPHIGTCLHSLPTLRDEGLIFPFISFILADQYVPTNEAFWSSVHLWFSVQVSEFCLPQMACK